VKTKVFKKRYTIRAVVFQEGDWLCVQCLEYDLVAQAKSLPKLSRAFHQLIMGHIAVRIRHKQQPFEGLARAPQKYWKMFQRSRLALPTEMFSLNGVKKHGFVVRPPELRVAPPTAA
jgi:hypothetical protein